MIKGATYTANVWRTSKLAILDTVGGLAVYYYKPIYIANNYSANPWRSAWRPDPLFGGLTPLSTGRPPDRHEGQRVAV